MRRIRDGLCCIGHGWTGCIKGQTYVRYALASTKVARCWLLHSDATTLPYILWCTLFNHLVMYNSYGICMSTDLYTVFPGILFPDFLFSLFLPPLQDYPAVPRRSISICDAPYAAQRQELPHSRGLWAFDSGESTRARRDKFLPHEFIAFQLIWYDNNQFHWKLVNWSTPAYRITGQRTANGTSLSLYSHNVFLCVWCIWFLYSSLGAPIVHRIWFL